MVRLVTSIEDTSTVPETVEVVFYIDNDDEPSIEAAISLQHNWQFPKVKYVVGERVLFSKMWNICADASNGEVLMLCDDEAVFRTNDWDAFVLRAFEQWPDKIGLVYGRDGIHDVNLATHPFIHRNWVNCVGYFVPPYFASDYNDTWLFEVSGMIGRRAYLPKVYIEHMHPCAGKAEWDTTHRERLARHRAQDSDKLYASLKSERQADAQKLRDWMNK